MSNKKSTRTPAQSTAQQQRTLRNKDRAAKRRERFAKSPGVIARRSQRTHRWAARYLENCAKRGTKPAITNRLLSVYRTTESILNEYATLRERHLA